MLDPNVFRDIEVSDKEIEAELQAAFGPTVTANVMEQTFTGQTGVGLAFDTLLKAKIVTITGNDVVLDVGLKSEGVVSLEEWDDPAQVKPGEIGRAHV